MNNPLINNMSEFTITQLEAKIADLQKKYFLTQNPDVRRQIVMNLDMFRDEATMRRALELHHQNEQMRKDGNKGLDGLINVS
jgi:hypothetical protein